MPEETEIQEIREEPQQTEKPAAAESARESEKGDFTEF